MDLAPVYLILIPVVASIFVYLTNDNYSNAVAFMSQVIISVVAVKYFQLQDGFAHTHSIILGGWSPVKGFSIYVLFDVSRRDIFGIASDKRHVQYLCFH
jgi:hypothetical protein